MRALAFRSRAVVVAVAGAATVAVVAFNSSTSLRGTRLTSSIADRMAVAASAPAPATAPSIERQAAAQTSDVASFWAAQKLIRSGDLRILVEDVRRAIDAADSIGRKHGALLADSRSAQGDQTPHDAQLQFRVPSDRFTETVAALRALGEVRGEAVTTQDVTREYADLDTRLRVKDETVTRLRALLATHTAKLADVLQVEQELARAVTELEQLKGARRYYDQQIALSSVTVALFEQQAIPPKAQFTDPLVAAFRHALEVLGTSFAGLVYGVVFILPWAIFAMLLWWLFMLSRRDPGSASDSV